MSTHEVSGRTTASDLRIAEGCIPDLGSVHFGQAKALTVNLPAIAIGPTQRVGGFRLGRCTSRSEAEEHA